MKDRKKTKSNTKHPSKHSLEKRDMKSSYQEASRNQDHNDLFTQNLIDDDSCTVSRLISKAFRADFYNIWYR